METVGKKKPRHRRSFTQEFKAEIVEACSRGDRTIGQVARDFDLTETAVRAWVKQSDIDAGRRDGLTTAEHEELSQLRRDNRRLRGRRDPQAGNSFLRQGDPVNLWPFIEVEEAEQHSVNRACELLEVSRAAYYEQRKHVPSRRALDDAELTTRITAIHDSSKGTYGAPRIHAQLRRDGICCAKKRVARLMVGAGLAGRCARRWRKTTIADPNAEARAVDLIRRVFGPDTNLDTRWCGDITYIPTWEGWAYLATVIDLASRRVVGWALADHMRTDLVADALRMACVQRRPPAGVIFHSDRGCQYTSGDYAALAADLGVTLSVGRKGECWDNAVSERFFATFKNELINPRPWPTRAGLRPAVFEFIEGWYNTRRLHSSLGYRSPAEYEATIHQETAARAA